MQSSEDRSSFLLCHKGLALTKNGKVSFILFAGFQEHAYAGCAASVMVLHHCSLQAIASPPMLSILRFILIVGAIFYYSPVRQQGEGTAAIEAFFTPKASEPAAPSPPPASEGPGHLETVWKALPDSAKQAVVDKIMTTSGFPMADASKPTDTLRPEDRALAASKPRT
jgi:hypothetical protein